MAKGPVLKPFPGVIALPIAIKRVVIGPSIFARITAAILAGTIHAPACCFPSVLGPTPTTTNERTSIAPTETLIASANESNKSMSASATITVAVNSAAFLTNKTTFKNLAGSERTRCTQAALLEDLLSSSSTNTREIEFIALSLPAKKPANRSSATTTEITRTLTLESANLSGNRLALRT